MDSASDGSKRKTKRPRNPKDTNQTVRLRTVKCSIGKLIHPNQTQSRTLIDTVVCHLNELQVLASWILKHHLFSRFERGDKITWKIDQTYIGKIFRFIRKPIEPNENDRSLYQSVRWVMERVQPKMTVSSISDSCYSQLEGFAARRMITNFKVHIQERLEASFKIWTTNQIKAVMTPKEYENPRRHLKRYRANLSQLSFYPRYQYWHALVETAETILGVADRDHESDDEEKLPTADYNTYLYWMWSMRNECENLEIQTGRQLKAISVLPQNDLKVGHVRFDTRIMAYLYRCLTGSKECIGSLESVENQEQIWGYFFDMVKLRRLRSGWLFNWSIMTDGISVCIPFGQLIPKRKTTKRKSKRVKPNRSDENSPLHVSSLPSGLYGEQIILNQFQDFDHTINWVGVDPGVKSILTSWSPTYQSSPFHLGQKEYKHSLGLSNASTQRYRKRMAGVSESLSLVPYGKTSMTNRLSLYLNRVRLYWDEIWTYQKSKGLRRQRFYQWNRNQSVCDQFVNDVRGSCPENSVLLFGNGGAKGGFRQKGGGFKGPILKLKRLLARRFPVICVDEFRTSKLCLDCGKVLKHPKDGEKLIGRNGRLYQRYMHGVSYCTDTEHHRMLNRDVDAAQKISCRFLCQLKGLDLGPWRRQADLSAAGGQLKALLCDLSSGCRERHRGDGVPMSKDVSQLTVADILQMCSDVGI